MIPERRASAVRMVCWFHRIIGCINQTIGINVGPGWFFHTEATWGRDRLLGTHFQYRAVMFPSAARWLICRWLFKHESSRKLRNAVSG